MKCTFHGHSASLSTEVCNWIRLKTVQSSRSAFQSRISPSSAFLWADANDDDERLKAKENGICLSAALSKATLTAMLPSPPTVFCADNHAGWREASMGTRSEPFLLNVGRVVELQQRQD